MTAVLNLEVLFEDSHLLFQVSKDAARIVSEKLFCQGELSQEYYFYWMLKAAKDLFFDHMPVAQVEFCCSENLKTEPFQTTLFKFFDVVQTSNAFLKEITPLKDMAKSHEGLFIYNVDNSSGLLELYESYEKKGLPVLYQNMPSGWDRKEGKFKFGNKEILTPRELLDFIARHRVKSILSLNKYYLAEMIKNFSIYLLPVLRFINAEYICYDLDTYEVFDFGDLAKAALNWRDFHRLSTMPNICLWDKALGNHNVSYVPVLTNPERLASLPELAGDYDLVMISNSRFKAILPQLEKCLFYLELCREEFLFFDIQLLYYVLRHFLFLSQWDLALKFKQDALLSQLHLNCLSLMKMEVLEGIKTDRRVMLYGDEGWDVVCPDKFMKHYLPSPDADQMMKSGGFVRLLVNQNFSWLENNPVHFDSIRKGHYFLCFPSLSRGEEFRAMESLEYKNLDELNRKINEVLVLYAQKALQNSRDAVLTNIKKSMDETRDFILSPGGKAVLQGTFWQQHERHRQDFKKMLDDYIRSRPRCLKELVDYLFLGKNFPLKPEECGFYGREYVQRLWHHRKKT